MLAQGLTTTIVGMLVVFFFLALLVVSMKIMSGVLLKYFPEAPEEPVQPRKRATDDSEIAAAVAAVTAFQQR